MKTQPHLPLFETDSPTEFSSTQEKTRHAIQDAMQRGRFFALNLIQLRFGPILDEIEAIARHADLEIWREAAHRLGIDPNALDVLDHVPICYPFYFCDPTQLVRSPSLVAYYRNLAMISVQVMQDIGLDTASHEAGQPLPLDKAEQLALYFNSTISTFVVTNPSLITSRRHIEMMFSNLGESIGDLWRNKAGE
jgi:hypothetical protein